MTTGIGIVVRTAVHVRVHNRHTIYDMRVNEEIYLNIIRSKKQQQSHCRYPCDSMFFTFHAAKVQRIFGTAKFLAKKIADRTILIKNVQIYLLHFLFIGEGSYLYRLLSRFLECANFLLHFMFIGEGSYLYRLLSRFLECANLFATFSVYQGGLLFVSFT